MAIRWVGGDPSICEICKRSVEGTFVDGKTTMGPWATMCVPCHKKWGVGIGTGRGQKYERQADGKWSKVEV
jgi:hypothetical protein